MSNKCYLTEVVLLTKSYNLQDFEDWLHWHLDIIGFDHCHVFDNESLADIKSICNSYGDRVSYELVKGWPNQYALYNRYINNENKAQWVLPIDDDEYLYVSDKYENNVAKFLTNWCQSHRDWDKICIGWRNLFPSKFTEERTNPHRILNATAWSNEASQVWQAGNRPVKTFVCTAHKYEWTDRIGHSTHDPLIDGKYLPGKTIYGTIVKNSWQVAPTPDDADLILYHYQFVSNQEWRYKCKNRKSPGSKSFIKDFPALYSKLYSFALKTDNRAASLFKRHPMPSWADYCLAQEGSIQKMFPDKNIKNPVTFTEKIQWLKIHDSSFLKTYCSDKITVHDYCKKKLGKDICIPILKVYNNVDEINLSELPKSFVIKCNHGSAMNIIVEDKSKLNLAKAKMSLTAWLNTDFSKFSELHYKLIPRKIYVEEFKSNMGKSDLTDYKLFCFNGTPKFWQVITDRRSAEKISHYDMDWKYAPIYDWRDYASASNIPRPKNYELMVAYAKKLAADFKMVRVDFYEIDGTVYLGELTFTPANGKQIFKNPNADKVIGDMLKL